MLSLAPLGLTYHRRTLAALNLPAAAHADGLHGLQLPGALTYLPFPFTFVILPLLWAAIALPRFEAFAVCFAPCC